MNQNNLIQVFEHDRLAIGGKFQEKHRKALLKLNELHSFNYLEATANGVAFKSYVGIIQVDQLIIEILPKIDRQSNSNINWRDVLLDMLKVSRHLKAHESDNASVQKRKNNLLDVYLDLFLREIENLIKRGLCKQYRLETSNTLALKGKLELAEHIKNNLVHKEKFYTTHQVYDHQHLIHQIIGKALKIVIDMTRQSYLFGKAGRVQLSFPEVNTTSVSLTSFDKVSLNKKTKQYKKALDLARIIIENYSPSIKAGESKMLALLFNMNNLWEQYVFSMLKKGQQSGKYRVSKPSKPLFKSESYSLQPDMFIEFKNGQKVIIDTKWKVPKKQKAGMQDLRQIYAYNHYWKANHGILLYPGNQKDSNWMSYEDGTDTLLCKLSFLNILNDHGKLIKEINLIPRLDLLNTKKL